MCILYRTEGANTSWSANFDDTASSAVSSRLSGLFRLGKLFIFPLMTNAVFERLTGPEPRLAGFSRFIYALLNPTPGLSADCGGHDFAKGRTMKRAYSKSQYAKPLAATAVITGTSATKAPCLRITGTWRRYEFRIFLRFSP